MLAFCPHGWKLYVQTSGEHLSKLCSFLWEQTKTISAGKHSDSSLLISTYQNQLPFQKGEYLGQFFNVHNQTTATQTVSGLTPSSTQVLRSVSRSFVAKCGQRKCGGDQPSGTCHRELVSCLNLSEVTFLWQNWKAVFSALLILLNDRHQVGMEGLRA